MDGKFDSAVALNADTRPKFQVTKIRHCLIWACTELALFGVPFATVATCLAVTAPDAVIAAGFIPGAQWLSAHIGDRLSSPARAENVGITLAGLGAALLAQWHDPHLGVEALLICTGGAMISSFWPQAFHGWRGATVTDFELSRACGEHIRNV